MRSYFREESAEVGFEKIVSALQNGESWQELNRPCEAALNPLKCDGDTGHLSVRAKPVGFPHLNQARVCIWRNGRAELHERLVNGLSENGQRLRGILIPI